MASIFVYINNGNVYEYEVADESKAREHASAIIQTGYRSVTEGDDRTITWFPPHRIEKIVLKLEEPSKTKYTDTILST